MPFVLTTIFEIFSVFCHVSPSFVFLALINKLFLQFFVMFLRVITVSQLHPP